MDDDKVMYLAQNPCYRGDVDERIRLWRDIQGRTTVYAEGDNPFCGDQLRMVALLASDDTGRVVFEDVCYEGYACSLCLASTETLIELIKGHAVEEALRITATDILTALGGIEVRRTRLRCVELCLSVLHQMPCEQRCFQEEVFSCATGA